MQKFLPDITAITMGGGSVAMGSATLFDLRIAGSMLTWGEFFTIFGVIVGTAGLVIGGMRLYYEHIKKD